eukprot:PhM_4_TR5476/c0_g1_i1/m.17971
MSSSVLLFFSWRRAVTTILIAFFLCALLAAYSMTTAIGGDDGINNNKNIIIKNEGTKRITTTTIAPTAAVHKNNNNNNNNDNLRFRVDVHTSRPHPTCLQCVWLKEKRNGVPFEVRDKLHHNCGCYKHGGHYKPGYARMNGTYLTLHNVVVTTSKADGLEISHPDIKSATTYSYSGHFTMVSGNWPQLVNTHVVVKPTTTKTKTTKITDNFTVAYFQPPTDFLSVYHVQCEVTLPMHHRIHIINNKPDVAITTRPTFSRYGFKPKSCAYGEKECLGTLFADMYGAEFYRRRPRSILGLEDDDKTRRYFVKKLLVGAPTHCEPLWGPDAYYNHVFEEHDARGGGGVKHGAAPGVKSILEECNNMLLSFKRLHVLRAGLPMLLEPKQNDNNNNDHHDDVFTLTYVTRKGAWARDIVNEDQFLQHLRNQFPRANIESVTFRGRNLTQQLLPLLKTDIFMGGHGAGLFQSLYLRPGSGLITLSIYSPGFYPFVMLPKWIRRWEDVLVDMTCNMRLWKKCKMSTPNNNDVLVTEKQMSEVVAAIKRIREKQR